MSVYTGPVYVTNWTVFDERDPSTWPPVAWDVDGEAVNPLPWLIVMDRPDYVVARLFGVEGVLPIWWDADVPPVEVSR